MDDAIRFYSTKLITEPALPFVIGLVTGIFLILIGYFTVHVTKNAKWIAITGFILEFACLFCGLFFFRVPVKYEYEVWINTDLISEEELGERYKILEKRGENYYLIEEMIEE